MLNRRQFISAATAAGALALASPIGSGLSAAQAQALPLGLHFDAEPFQLGVASGDPLPDSVILWTRLTTDPLNGGGMPDEPIEVRWAIARDPRMRRIIDSGTVAAQPAFGHSVHIDVSGLQPGTVYFYAFSAMGRTSRIGRTKTAPTAPTDHVRFGFGSCQDFAAGRYGAYADVVAQDLDFFVHLGDYMYEGGGAGETGAREHTGAETESLEDYRNRYALYRGDPQLRQAHAHLPFIMTWDDHEVQDNYAANNPHPTQQYVLPDDGSEPPEFIARKAAAYQAWYEMFPIRVPAGLPNAETFQIFRHLAFGDLISMPVIDTRQYRDAQAYPELPSASIEAASEDRTILGADQREWLLGLMTSTDAAWRCIANQVEIFSIRITGIPPEVAGPLSQTNRPLLDVVGLNGDGWDGYQHDRTLLQGALVEAGQFDNIVLTGDIHSFWTADLREDYNDADSQTLGSEFIGGSITSGGNGAAGSNQAFEAAVIAGGNAHIAYVEAEHRGYGICDVTPNTWRTTYRLLTDVDRTRPTFLPDPVFEVTRGTPGVVRLR